MHRASVEIALDYLIGLGHRSIAYVTDGGRSVFSRRSKLESFRDAGARLGLALSPAIVTEVGDEASFVTAQYARIGEAAAEIVVRDWPGVTAAVLFSDFVAPGLVTGLARHGLAVPRDFSVVGIDGIVMGEILSPPLTSVREPLDRVATFAVDCLIRRIEGQGEASQPLLVRPELLVRESAARSASA